MITFKGEDITEDEHKEILFADIKIDYYNIGGFPRFINDIPNIVNYRPSAFTKNREMLHKGQYKLYLSELDFLTDYARYNSLIIYIGAAAGHHINDLYENFKHMNLSYHLYDINYFDSLLHTKEKITLFNEYFTDEHYKKYINYSDILFISDIRNMDVLKNDKDVVPDDMKFQMNWVMQINPRACMLKFRLPYSSNIPVEYLDGEIRLQAYAAASTTECRLVAERPYKIRMYDPEDNEKRMFYLNKIIRRWYKYDALLEKYIIDKFKKNIEFS